MASLFFFVSKKDGRLRPTQDYQYLNQWTIKNAHPLPLISDIMDKSKPLEPNTSPNSIFDGATIMFGLKKVMNGEQHLKPTWGYSNQWSCSLGCAIHRQYFKR